MHAIGLWLALATAPFWETKAPRDWSDAEVKQLITDSPWAQDVDSGVSVFLATAHPIRQAEQEWMRRRKVSDPDFAEFMDEDQGQHIVLAVAYPDAKALANAPESRRMEDESILKVGKRRFKLTGHFPPTPSDPYLRLVFPREIAPGDKSLVFELYLPGVSMSYRTVEFRFKDLLYRGKPEM
jgi:hypothetical protein